MNNIYENSPQSMQTPQVNAVPPVQSQPIESPQPTQTATQPLQTIQNVVISEKKLFMQLMFIGAILGIGRFFFPFPGLEITTLMSVAFSIGLFLLGVFIAPFIFLMEPRWKQLLVNKFSLELPGEKSPLRTGIIFILLPVLGIFIVTSSLSPIGLGFVWGVTAWYLTEVWQILNIPEILTQKRLLVPLTQTGENFWRAYFPTQPIGDEQTRTFLWIFCLYAALLSFGILII